MNILVVVDMQNDFITGELANPTAKRIIPGIVQEMKSNKYDVICITRDTHSYADYHKTVEGKHLPILHCDHLQWGWEVVEPIQHEALRQHAHFVNKDSFASTVLLTWCKAWLHDDAISAEERINSNITLVGTCTDICVISNALLLKTLRCEVSVIEKLCAGTTKENHDAAIQIMRQCHVNIL